MHAYPPEYDDPCVASIPCDMPAYFQQWVYWDEDGTVFVQEDEERQTRHDLFDFEPTDDQDADEAAIKAKVQAIFSEQDEEIQALGKAVEQAWRECQNKPVPDFDEFWDGITDYVGLECGEAGDWTPEWCDDCNTWHQTAYCVEFKVEDGERFIVIKTVDQDGDWDTQYYSESEFRWVYRECILSDHFFYQWANYWLWCARHGGIDPLSECRYWAQGPLTVEQCIEYAKDNLKYLKGEVR